MSLPIADILSDIASGIEESVIIHGDWSDYQDNDIFAVILEEFAEYREAYLAGVVHGDHGQLDELRDLAIVAIKGIIQLSRT